MRRIAIFAEGQSELIFVRCFLPLILGWDKISFECFRLYANEMSSVPFRYPNEHAEVHYLIVNVGNDETVLSAVKDREELLIQKGYEKVIALRDMYCEAYYKRAGTTIDDAITLEFINSFQGTIESMSDPTKIKMCFAIMEFEAWLLGMYSIFERVEPTLTVGYIEEKLGFNLSVIDPQGEFFKPANKVSDILGLVGLEYKKSEDDIESICSKMEEADFSKAFENGRCSSFKDFWNEVRN